MDRGSRGTSVVCIGRRSDRLCDGGHFHGVIGYFVYEGQLWENASRRSHEQVMALEEENKTLSEQNSKLEEQVTEQAEEIQILSDTVSQKVQSESELSATLEKQSLPTEFPLTGSASMEEVSEGDPMCIFHASVGTTVVAAASGTVIAINDDEIYGHSVWVDHGNGYVTIYRNKGDTTVNVEDSVVQGTTLFVIGEDNADLGYQMQKDGSYINPMDMLAISG